MTVFYLLDNSKYYNNVICYIPNICSECSEPILYFQLYCFRGRLCSNSTNMPSGNERRRAKRAEKRNRKLKNKIEQKLPTYVVAYGIQEICDDQKPNTEAVTADNTAVTTQKEEIHPSPEISNYTNSSTSIVTQQENNRLDETQDPENNYTDKYDENETDCFKNAKFEKSDKTMVSEFIKEYTGPEPEIVFTGYKRKKAKTLTSKATKKSKVLVDKKIKNINLKNHQQRIKRQMKIFYSRSIGSKIRTTGASLTKVISRQSILKKVSAKENLLDYIVQDDSNKHNYVSHKLGKGVKNKSLLNMSFINPVVLQHSEASVYFQNQPNRKYSMTEVIVEPNKTDSNILTSLEAQKIMSAIVALSADHLDKPGEDDDKDINEIANTSSSIANPKSLSHLADWAFRMPKFCGRVSPTKFSRQGTSNQNNVDARDALSKGDFGEIGQLLTENVDATIDVTETVLKDKDDDIDTIDEEEASKTTLVQQVSRNKNYDIAVREEVTLETVMPSNTSSFIASDSFSSSGTLTERAETLLSNDSSQVSSCRTLVKVDSAKTTLGINDVSVSSDIYFKILSDDSSQRFSGPDSVPSAETHAAKNYEMDPNTTNKCDTVKADNKSTTASTTDTDVDQSKNAFQNAFQANSQKIYNQSDQNIAVAHTISPMGPANPITGDYTTYEAVYCPGTLTDLLTSFELEEVVSTPAESEKYLSTIRGDNQLTESSYLTSEGSYFTSTDMYSSCSDDITLRPNSDKLNPSEIKMKNLEEIMAAGAFMYLEQSRVTDSENLVATENLTDCDTISQRTVTPTRNLVSTITQTCKTFDAPRCMDSANLFEGVPHGTGDQELSRLLEERLKYSISNSKSYPQPIDSGMLIRREIMKNELMKIRSSLDKLKINPPIIDIDEVTKEMIATVSTLPSEVLSKFLSTLEAKQYLTATTTSDNDYMTENTWMMSSETLVANESRTKTLKYTSLEAQNIAEQVSRYTNDDLKSKDYKKSSLRSKTSEPTTEIDSSRDMMTPSKEDFNDIKVKKNKYALSSNKTEVKKDQDWQMIFEIIDTTIKKLEDNLVTRLTKELKVHFDAIPPKLNESQLEEQPVDAKEELSQELEQVEQIDAAMFPQSIQCNLLDNNEINDLMREFDKRYDKKAQSQTSYPVPQCLYEEETADLLIKPPEHSKIKTKVENPIKLAEIDLDNEIISNYDYRLKEECHASKTPFKEKQPVEIELEDFRDRKRELVVKSVMSLIEIERDETTVYMDTPTVENVCVARKDPPIMLKPLWFIKENWFIITWVPFFYVVCMFVVYGAFAICVYFFG